MYTKVTAYDLETTGFSPKRDSIIEVGAVSLCLKTKTLTSFSTLICNPMIPDKVTKLTGISNKTLIEESCLDLNSALIELQSFLTKSLIVGHNILNFDNNFLRAHSDIHIRDSDCQDTLKLARQKGLSRGSKTALKRSKKTKQSYNLDACLKALGIKDPCKYLTNRFPYAHECTPACKQHRALRDAHAAFAIYSTIKRK